VDQLVPDLLLSNIGSLLIDHSHLQVVRRLGEGAFGTIDEAVWQAPNTTQSISVAVKQLKLKYGIVKRFTDFAREAWIMQFVSFLLIRSFSLILQNYN
jgi:serine/threonine protein kinase